MSRTRPQVHRSKPGYPNREEAPKPDCDASRRRFLRQLAAGTGAAVVGLPRLGHGQSLAVDFDKLSGHPAPLDTSERLVRSEEAADFDDFDGEMAEAEPMAEAEDSDEEAPVADAQEPAESEAWVDENRALWVEPGYLILLQWRRQADDEAVVMQLEGSATAVEEFLASRVTNVDQLHNIEQLHVVEGDLVGLLATRLHPAQVRVLHLDHDCTVVCSALDPSREYPEIYEVDGEMPSPGWR